MSATAASTSIESRAMVSEMPEVRDGRSACVWWRRNGSVSWHLGPLAAIYHITSSASVSGVNGTSTLNSGSPSASSSLSVSLAGECQVSWK